MQLADAVDQIRPAIVTPGVRGASHRLFELDSGQYLAFWGPAHGERATVLLVLGETSLRSRVWRAMLSAATSDGVAIALVAPDGAVVFTTAAAAGGGMAGAGTPAGSRLAIARERTFRDGDFLWRVRATPERLDALYASEARRRWLYLAMLVVMVGGLLAAGLVVGRALRPEGEVARLKSQFVSAVSHEFRSPLTGISQLSELLVGAKVTDDTRRQQYYELIHRESRRLSRLVE